MGDQQAELAGRDDDLVPGRQLRLSLGLDVMNASGPTPSSYAHADRPGLPVRCDQAVPGTRARADVFQKDIYDSSK